MKQQRDHDDNDNEANLGGGFKLNLPICLGWLNARLVIGQWWQWWQWWQISQWRQCWQSWQWWQCYVDSPGDWSAYFLSVQGLPCSAPPDGHNFWTVTSMIKGRCQKNFFFGWVGRLIPKQGPNPSKPPKSPRKSPFSTQISPFGFPNLTKTLGWLGG